MTLRTELPVEGGSRQQIVSRGLRAGKIHGYESRLSRAHHGLVTFQRTSLALAKFATQYMYAWLEGFYSREQVRCFRVAAAGRTPSGNHPTTNILLEHRHHLREVSAAPSGGIFRRRSEDFYTRETLGKNMWREAVTSGRNCRRRIFDPCAEPRRPLRLLQCRLIPPVLLQLP